MDKKKILDYQLIKKKIVRISLQIIEANSTDDEIIIDKYSIKITEATSSKIEKVLLKKIQSK